MCHLQKIAAVLWRRWERYIYVWRYLPAINVCLTALATLWLYIGDDNENFSTTLTKEREKTKTLHNTVEPPSIRALIVSPNERLLCN